MKIGVLALQGAFIEHRAALARLGIKSSEIRQSKHLLEQFDAIILPGGESSTMGKLLYELNMLKPIRELILSGLPVMGTCAGLILMAKQIVNQPHTHLATMDITVCRNAYGRQLDSFNCIGGFAGQDVLMPFIRAPYIQKSDSPDVQILATIDNRIVAARQGKQLALTFHPELTTGNYVHQYFLDIILGRI